MKAIAEGGLVVYAKQAYGITSALSVGAAFEGGFMIGKYGGIPAVCTFAPGFYGY